MGSSQSTPKPEPPQEVIKVRELNTNISDKIKNIQNNWDDLNVIQNLILDLTKNVIFTKSSNWTNLLNENKIDELLEDISAINTVLVKYYICENNIQNPFYSPKFIEEKYYERKEWFDEPVFGSCKAFTTIDKYNEVNKKNIRTLISSSENIKRGENLELDKVYSIMYRHKQGIRIIEYKIRDEKRYYEGKTLSPTERLKRWTCGLVSWISRSGNGYSATAKKWDDIISPGNIIDNMNKMVTEQFDNFKSAKGILDTVKTEIDNLDYLIQKDNDKLIFKAEQSFTFSRGDDYNSLTILCRDYLNASSHHIYACVTRGTSNTIVENQEVIEMLERGRFDKIIVTLKPHDKTTISFGNIRGGSYHEICSKLNRKLNTYGIFVSIVNGQNRYNITSKSFLFTSDNSFTIFRESTIRTIIGFERADYECSFNSNTNKHFVNSAIPLYSEIQNQNGEIPFITFKNNERERRKVLIRTKINQFNTDMGMAEAIA